jgi:hypothetical protein
MRLLGMSVFGLKQQAATATVYHKQSIIFYQVKARKNILTSVIYLCVMRKTAKE